MCTREILFVLCYYKIYSSETIGKAEARRQSKAFIRAEHANNVGAVALGELPLLMLLKKW
jgi:hypothetical protein